MLRVAVRISPSLVLAMTTVLFILVSVARGDEVPSYPAVTKGWGAAQALLARMAQVYEVPPPALQIDRFGHYRDGVIYMRDATLDTDVKGGGAGPRVRPLPVSPQGLNLGAASEVREATTVARLFHRRRGGQAGATPVR